MRELIDLFVYTLAAIMIFLFIIYLLYAISISLTTNHTNQPVTDLDCKSTIILKKANHIDEELIQYYDTNEYSKCKKEFSTYYVKNKCNDKELCWEAFKQEVITK